MLSISKLFIDGHIGKLIVRELRGRDRAELKKDEKVVSELMKNEDEKREEREREEAERAG